MSLYTAAEAVRDYEKHVAVNATALFYYIGFAE